MSLQMFGGAIRQMVEGAQATVVDCVTSRTAPGVGCVNGDTDELFRTFPKITRSTFLDTFSVDLFTCACRMHRPWD